jgi:hypothetical protein
MPDTNTQNVDTIIDTDWRAMTLGERIRHLEVEGYVVLPELLSPDQVRSLHDQLESIETIGTDYTDKKQVHDDIQWAGGAITELIAHFPTIAFLKTLFGCDPIMMTYDYSRSEPGCPPIMLHADGQPWGTKIFGPEQSCPKLIRVLYYMQDLTPQRAPFRVVPRSHLSFHNDANPYLRYRKHPEQVMVTCSAGDACLINQNVFHGNYANTTDTAREMLGIAYRPSWAGPCGQVDAWPAEQIDRLPGHVRAVLSDRNTRIWNYDGANVPTDLKDEAQGINPSRWESR